MRTLAILLGLSCLLMADDEPKAVVKASHTERIGFPAAGRLRLQNSIGEVSIMGWDKPDVEVTTVISTKAEFTATDKARAQKVLDQVKIAVAREGDDIVVKTDYELRRGLPLAWITKPAPEFDVEYRIMMPMNGRLAVEHRDGEVHVDNLTSDINISVHDGLITLMLPPDAKYSIDAKSKLGSVTSDYTGTTKREHWFGHELVKDGPSDHKLTLKVAFGDITIYQNQKTVLPPGPPTQ